MKGDNHGRPCWTHIKIGGAIDPKGIDALIEALFDDFHGYSETPDEAVTEMIRNNACFSCSGLCSGDPEITVADCRARGLTFSFCYDSHAEWDAGGKYWTPGMTTPKSFPAQVLSLIGSRFVFIAFRCRGNGVIPKTTMSDSVTFEPSAVG